jgi:hypothetical protein
MKKQTAVDWFYNAIEKNTLINLSTLYEQAKAMEKEQMEELALDIYEYSVTCFEKQIDPDGKKQFEQYYNETYKP